MFQSNFHGIIVKLDQAVIIHANWQRLQARGKWGAGGLQPPNNSLKFADFVSEKGCKSQGHKKKDSNLSIFEEATIIYQKCNIC